jgi:hypothetical protein
VARADGSTGSATGRYGGAGGYGGTGGDGAGRTAADDRAGPGTDAGAAFGGTTASKAMISYLEAHRDGATWLVAVDGSSAAAQIILKTSGIPVMAMGGFRGTDQAPALAQFQQYVQAGKIHYVEAGGSLYYCN